jgi:uncharacterized protein (DUF488 family)
VRVFTIGHGRRSVEELVETLRGAGAKTLVDVRRYPGSRRNPQFNRESLAKTVSEGGITYRHAVELGGRVSDDPGERFACIRPVAFRSYAARMGAEAWQAALAEALTHPAPCFMCAETLWQRCHRRLIAELLWARGDDVHHLLGPRVAEAHRPWDAAEAHGGTLYLCGERVA